MLDVVTNMLGCASSISKVIIKKVSQKLCENSSAILDFTKSFKRIVIIEVCESGM